MTAGSPAADTGPARMGRGGGAAVPAGYGLGGALVWSSLTVLALGMVKFPPPVPVGTAGRQA
jgi:hypothetical protein